MCKFCPVEKGRGEFGGRKCIISRVTEEKAEGKETSIRALRLGGPEVVGNEAEM